MIALCLCVVANVLCLVFCRTLTSRKRYSELYIYVYIHISKLTMTVPPCRFIGKIHAYQLSLCTVTFMRGDFFWDFFLIEIFEIVLPYSTPPIFTLRPNECLHSIFLIWRYYLHYLLLCSPRLIVVLTHVLFLRLTDCWYGNELTGYFLDLMHETVSLVPLEMMKIQWCVLSGSCIENMTASAWNQSNSS